MIREFLSTSLLIYYPLFSLRAPRNSRDRSLLRVLHYFNVGPPFIFNTVLNNFNRVSALFIPKFAEL